MIEDQIVTPQYMETCERCCETVPSVKPRKEVGGMFLCDYCLNYIIANNITP